MSADPRLLLRETGGVEVSFVAVPPLPGSGCALIVGNGAEKDQAELHAATEPWALCVAVKLKAKASPEAARKAGALAAQALIGTSVVEAVCAIPLTADAAIAFAQGFRARAYLPLSLQTRTEAEDRHSLARLTLVCEEAEAATKAWEKPLALAIGQEAARTLTAEPANRLTPQAFTEVAQSLTELGVEVEVLDATALRKAGMGLHLAVGQASVVAPRLVILRWKGGAPDEAPTLLVGKGLTFDSGGISIKPALHMEEMKGDMAGAAAVFGALAALARLKAPVTVTGLLALAENMPGGNAFRPGDILTAHNGKTVEIIDTDAEGRLVLADALSYGCAIEHPARVVSLATLTGACVVTLGHHRAGLFATEDTLADALFQAGEKAEEPLWRLPFADAKDEGITSDVADLRQCAPAGRLNPDALQAAAFLRAFVPEGIPFAHLDIAGVSERTETDADALHAAGPTGFGVGCLIRLLMD